MASRSVPVEPQIVTVEASAGSGKTRELAASFLRLLLGEREIPLRSILAVTFTNKAAVEMKERIIASLKALALAGGTPGDRNELCRRLGLDAGNARRRAREALPALLADYSAFRVQTIDSLVNEVLAGCAFALGRSSRPDVRTDHGRFLVLAIDELLEAARSSPAVARAFLSCLDRDLAAGRTGWFPIRTVEEAAFALYTWRTTFGLAPVPGAGGAPAQDAARRCGEISRRLLDLAPADTLTRNGRAALERIALAAGGAPLRWSGLGKTALSPSLPARKSAQLPAAAREAWTALRGALADAALAESFTRHDPFVAVDALVEERLEERCRAEDILFVAELNRRARDLVAAGVGLPEIYLRLAGRFRHYLFDEFQDTSRLRWENLLPMIEDALASGGTLFAVGDRKQAIFRFTGGDPGLLGEIASRFPLFSSARRTLTDNHRSARLIVTFNNRVFSPENLGRFLAGEELEPGDREAILGVFRDAAQAAVSRDEGRVLIDRCPVAPREEGPAGETPDEGARERVLRHLAELRETRPRGTVAVLCRTNREAGQVSRWLIEENIPVASEQTLDIRRNAVVSQLLALLAFLHAPADEIAFALFISGEVFRGAADIPASAMSAFLLETGRGRRGRGIAKYLLFRDRFPAAWAAWFAIPFRQVGFLPTYELTCTLIRRFRVLERFPDAHAFCMKLLEVVKDAEEEHGDLASFLEHVETGDPAAFFIPAPAGESIRVMTIHKAKGLDFDAVLLPFFRMAVTVTEPPLSLLPVPAEEGLRLLHLPRELVPFSPRLAAIHRAARRDALLDELNAAYVALTRPRTELRIIIPPGPAGERAARLLPADAGPAPPPAAVPDRAGDAAPVPELAAPPPEDWLARLREEFARPAEIAARDRRLQGEVVHAVLAAIGTPAAGERFAAVREAIRLARPRFPRWSDWEAVRKAADRFVASPALAPFFRPGAEILREAEIVDEKGASRRVDRLAVGEHEVFLVDFATGEDAPEKDAQVREYLRLLRLLFPEKTVRGLIASVSARGVREIDG